MDKQLLIFSGDKTEKKEFHYSKNSGNVGINEIIVSDVSAYG